MHWVVISLLDYGYSRLIRAVTPQARLYTINDALHFSKNTIFRLPCYSINKHEVLFLQFGCPEVIIFMYESRQYYISRSITSCDRSLHSDRSFEALFHLRRLHRVNPPQFEC